MLLQYCKAKSKNVSIFEKRFTINNFSFLQNSTNYMYINNVGHNSYNGYSFNYRYSDCLWLYLWTLMSLSKYLPEGTLVIIFRKILDIIMTHLSLITSVRHWVICAFYAWGIKVLKHSESPNTSYIICTLQYSLAFVLWKLQVWPLLLD